MMKTKDNNMNRNIAPTYLCFCVAGLFTVFSEIGCAQPQTNEAALEWPEISQEARPWSRWWWQGSSVTKAGITAELEAYQKAGLGGLELTPIYGLIGKEDQFIDYLSSEWMELLEYTLQEAGRLGLGIDMATCAGWPFGGPWVSAEDACKYMTHKKYELKGGECRPTKTCRPWPSTSCGLKSRCRCKPLWPIPMVEKS